MSAFHVYIKPFADDQGTAYETDWLEVTEDVVEIGNLTQSLDNSEYEIGVLRASSMKLSLLNHHGKYSDVGNIETIFKYKRGDSLVRVSWEPGDGPLVAGFFTAGAPGSILSEEIDLFEGLLSDIATQSKIDDADVDFQILGYESLLSQVIVPYADITNGDTFEEVILASVDQAPLNQLVTVDVANIDVGTSVTIDDKTKLENKTAFEALKLILLAANSVLYIRDGVLTTGPRTPGADLAFTFYGPGASDGIENIVDIQKYRTGLNKVRNFWTWKDTDLFAQDATSRAQYGTQKREIDLSLVTDNSKQEDILEALKDEFSLAKREMELQCFFTPDTLALFLLDRVKVDYPSVPLPVENQKTAQYEVPEGYDVDYYADELLPLTIEPTARFKIMNRVLDMKSETIKFSLREI